MTERDTERDMERDSVTEGMISGWNIQWPPQGLGPSPIDSARRVTSIPIVSHTGSPTKYTIHLSVTQKCDMCPRPVGRPVGRTL